MEPTIEAISISTARASEQPAGLVWQDGDTFIVFHEANRAMTVRLTLAAPPLHGRRPSAKAIYFTANLSLKRADVRHAFTKKGSFFETSGVAAVIQFSVQIPPMANEYEAKLTVDWAEDGIKPLGSGSPTIKFNIYFVNPNNPVGGVTYARLQHAMEIRRLSGSVSAHGIITWIHQRLPGYNAQANVPNPWTVAGQWNPAWVNPANHRVGGFPNFQVDCQSMARYLKWLLDLLGIQVTASSVVVIFACPVKPHMALEATLQPNGSELHCQNPDLGFGQLYNTRDPGNYLPLQHPYRRVQFSAQGHLHFGAPELLDGGNNPNFYEACFKLEASAQTWYYPGGVGARIDTRINVLRVFARMSWRVNGALQPHFNYATGTLTTHLVDAGGNITGSVDVVLPLIDGGFVNTAAAVRALMQRAGDLPQPPPLPVAAV